MPFRLSFRFLFETKINMTFFGDSLIFFTQRHGSTESMNQSKKTAIKTLLGWCGSMVVAIVLMALMMILLAWATFVENKYGAGVSQFAIYRTWWFDVLLTVFGGNVLCALLYRLPWRWGHMPFVVAHIGVLILLIGCWVTSRYGLEAQLTVFEGELARFAQKVSGDEINIEIINFRKQDNDNQSRDGNVAVEDQSEYERLARERLDGLRDKTKIKSPGLVLQPELDALALNRHERIPITLGPMSWRDYDGTAAETSAATTPIRQLLQLAKRSRGIVYNKDGIRVELLDYMADSRLKQAEQLQVRLQASGFRLQEEASNEVPEVRSPEPETWLTRDLPLGQSSADARGNDPYLAILPDERISYRLAKSNAETAAFLGMPKEQPTGTWGSVVMRVGGKNHVIAVDELDKRWTEFGGRIERMAMTKEDAELAVTALRVQLLAPSEGVDVEALKTQLAEKEAAIEQWEKELDELHAKIRVPVGETGLSVVMPRFAREYLQMMLVVYREDDTPYTLAVGGDQPLDATVPDMLGMQIMHLFDPETILKEHPQQPITRAMKPRLDLLQGRDQQLYYRFWDGRKYSQSGKLRTDQTVSSFEGHDGSTLKIAIGKYEPHDYPGLKLEPFSKPTGSKMQSVPCVKVRVCVDDVGDETYWVQKSVMLTPSAQLGEHQVGFVPGQNRTVAVMFPMAWLDLGFSLFLHKFERKLEPGIGMPSHFSSLVSVFPINDKNADTTDREPLYEQVLIRMNQPGMFADQLTGRKYRVFQTSYQGPFHPGMDMYQMRQGSQLIDDETRPRESLYSSTLTANYDPGRGLKYLGSLMLVLGSLAFFYTRRGVRDEGRVSLASSPCDEVVVAEVDENKTNVSDNRKSKRKNKKSHGKNRFPILLLLFGLFVPAMANSSQGDEANDTRPSPLAPRHSPLDWRAWEELPVFFDGRVMPLATFARITVTTICGRSSPILELDESVIKEAIRDGELDEKLAARIRAKFSNQSPQRKQGARKFRDSELIFSWLVEPEVWEFIPFLDACDKDLRVELAAQPTEGRYVSPYQVKKRAMNLQRVIDQYRKVEANQVDDEKLSKDGIASLRKLGPKVGKLNDALNAFRALTNEPDAMPVYPLPETCPGGAAGTKRLPDAIDARTIVGGY